MRGGYGGYEDSEKGAAARFFDRVLEDPSNPLGWSVRLFEVIGITVRLHVVTAVFFVAMVLSSLGLERWSFSLMLVAMGAAFVLVLVHEFGHCLACRRVGGEADRIVMLPFGGLALTRPPSRWKAHLVTTVGGPAVHVPIGLVTSVGLVLLGQGHAVLFNPLNLGATIVDIAYPGEPVVQWLVASLFIVHAVNAILFGFNVLMVFFPFDGGRVVQALLWRKMGYLKSMTAAVHVGIGGAIVVGIVGIVGESATLVAIAFFGGIACWAERQRLRAVDEITGMVPGEDDGGYGSSLAGGGSLGMGGEDEEEERGPSKRELRAAEREAAERAELDRVLDKISSEGRDSLTRKEKRFLAEQTAKRRGD